MINLTLLGHFAKTHFTYFCLERTKSHPSFHFLNSTQLLKVKHNYLHLLSKHHEYSTICRVEGNQDNFVSLGGKQMEKYSIV